MKVLHLSTYDVAGGAAKAAYRLHDGLVKHCSVDSRMLVMRKTCRDERVIGPGGALARAWALLAPRLSMLPARLNGHKGPGIFSTQSLPGWLSAPPSSFDPDLIHLHWIAGGFVSIEDLPSFGKPLVWTMHDMWPFTGGCHCDGGCGRFVSGCGECPQLSTARADDLSARVFERKLAAWRDLDLTFVGPSRWMTACAAASPVTASHEVVHLPYGVDTEVFAPVEKGKARELFGLPPDRRVLLFGAYLALESPIKGFNFLREAVARLACVLDDEKVLLVIFGSDCEVDELDLDLPTRSAGRIGDEKRLAALYSAADVFVAPSLQDNLPNTVLEALSCGTPCVAFDVGGMADLLRDRVNGRLVRPFDVDELASAIAALLGAPLHELERLSGAARDTVLEGFSQQACASAHLRLYERVLA